MPSLVGGSLRFIPAYAGNTADSSSINPFNPVHPRIRGEHIHQGAFGRRSAGSSPHTRGTPGATLVYSAQSRFIPAYAGNTSRTPARPDTPTVHPRIRGEHFIDQKPVVFVAGSSPHTRGTQDRRLRAVSVERFIPAYAGNTSTHDLCDNLQPVHPRIRGEHVRIRPHR